MSSSAVRDDAAKRVAKGAKWLDENHPGWASKIQLNELNMAFCVDCVAGQVLGDYYRLPENMDTVAFGFDVSDRVEYGYGELQTAWEAEIRKRLEAETC